MSNDDEQIFVNMKILIFLIVLDFIPLCFSLHANLTHDSDYPSCPISSFRGKRALKEYTRWRSNQVTKREFIVKVDDDVISSTTSLNINPILAINIQPATKAAEKIIISGAIVPVIKPVIATETPLEYTRFVPPTTENVNQVESELYRDPASTAATQTDIDHSHNRLLFPKFAAKHSHRDESPPASPQFISRTPTMLARQYVPITPVAFFPRVGQSPLTPSASLQPVLRKKTLHPHRTSILTNIGSPTRTDSNSEIFSMFQTVQDMYPLDSLLNSLENVYSQSDNPVRGSNLNFVTTEVASATSHSSRERQEGSTISQVKEISTAEPDLAYHMIYEEANEISTRKNDQESEQYETKRRKSEDVYENLKNESEKDLNVIESINGDKYVENFTSKEVLKPDYDDEDTTNDEEIIFSSTTSEFEEEEVTTMQYVRGKRRPVCNLLKLRHLDFNSPRTLPEIVAQLKQWTDDSPIAKWIDISDDNYTTMENPLYMMIIDDPSRGQVLSAKHTVLIVAGIQGRDHHAVAAALYILYQLIDRSEAHEDLLTKYRFWIIPVLNPDGYDYSMTFPQRREWPKNLRQSWDSCNGRESCRACVEYGLRCTVQLCYGVNLDRNFEYQWIPPEELQAEHPCGELYAGPRQLSERETRALTRFLHNQQTPLHTFIALKEGDVLGVMYPYSHTRKKRTYDHVYRQRASRAAAAAYSINGRPYVAGQTSEFLPLYAGGIEDWVDGHLGIDNTYTIMMFRPTDSYNVKQITERVIHEAYAAMDTLLLQSIELPSPHAVRLSRSAGFTITLPASLIIQTTLMTTLSS